MNNWVEVQIPSSYSIRKESFKCRSCGTVFSSLFSNGNDLVKFTEDGGTEVKWLPTFEQGGYLDILEEVVPGFKKNQSVTMAVAKKFESSFKNMQEPSKAGNTFSVAVGCRCPSCNSDNKELLSEEVLESPKLDWLRYQLN